MEVKGDSYLFKEINGLDKVVSLNRLRLNELGVHHEEHYVFGMGVSASVKARAKSKSNSGCW